VITAETKVYRLMDHDLRTLFGLKNKETIRELTVTTSKAPGREGKFVRLDVVVDRPDKGANLKKVEWK
jgi:hypothetical protein